MGAIVECSPARLDIFRSGFMPRKHLLGGGYLS